MYNMYMHMYMCMCMYMCMYMHMYPHSQFLFLRSHRLTGRRRRCIFGKLTV